MTTFITRKSKAKGEDVTFRETMERYPFIFSDTWNWRWKRHAAFWLWWWLFQGFLYSFSAFGMNIPYFTRLPMSMVEALFYLLPHMFLAYTFMYWVVPRILLRGHYARTVAAVAFLFLATACISSTIGVFLLPAVRRVLLGRIFVAPPHENEVFFFISLLAGLRGAITIGGMAAAIKLMKYWYVKEQRNLQLQKENSQAQLQLLKAQVHPHFLFNTLNNIYSHTQNAAPVGARLVMGLSDMLRYMLYECNQPLVPLQKELKMLQDYIVLEQIRYNQQLDVHLDLPEETEGLLIAPLLLLPFVENCFKHGASQMLEHPWVSMTLRIQDEELRMKLVNGKNARYQPRKAPGIGIENARKRLELIYPGKHNLRISNDEDVFVVSLNVKLESEGVKTEKRRELKSA